MFIKINDFGIYYEVNAERKKVSQNKTEQKRQTYILYTRRQSINKQA